MVISSYTWNLANQCFILAITFCLSVKCAEMKFQKTATHAFLCTLGVSMTLKKPAIWLDVDKSN